MAIRALSKGRDRSNHRQSLTRRYYNKFNIDAAIMFIVISEQLTENIPNYKFQQGKMMDTECLPVTFIIIGPLRRAGLAHRTLKMTIQ